MWKMIEDKINENIILSMNTHPAKKLYSSSQADLKVSQQAPCLRTSVPAFKLQASAQALASPAPHAQPQVYSQLLLWLTPHVKWVPLFLPQKCLWVRSSLLINPHGLAGVPSISHLQALHGPPYSLLLQARFWAAAGPSSHTALPITVLLKHIHPY